MLRSVLLSASRSDKLRQVATDAPPARAMVDRFVAGETAADAVRATSELVASGRLVTIDHLGEDTLDLAQAQATRDAYLELLGALGEAGLTASAEVSVKLSAVGQALPGDGEKIALENARAIAEKATALGTTVTLDMEDHTTTDSTLSVLRKLRGDFPTTGAVLQAYLYRTEADCRDLAHEGSRVRLCKGAYKEPASVALQKMDDIRAAYKRQARLLLDQGHYPALATHDESLIQDALQHVREKGYARERFEFQMLYGLRPKRWDALVREGWNVRIYVPYGTHWFPYFYRRLRERKENVFFVLRGIFE